MLPVTSIIAVTNLAQRREKDLRRSVQRLRRILCYRNLRRRGSSNRCGSLRGGARCPQRFARCASF
jgi:hypothetical protein